MSTLARRFAPPIHWAVARCPAKIRATPSDRHLDAMLSSSRWHTGSAATWSISSIFTTSSGVAGVGVTRASSPPLDRASIASTTHCRCVPGPAGLVPAEGVDGGQRRPPAVLTVLAQVDLHELGVGAGRDPLGDARQQDRFAAALFREDADDLAALVLVPQGQPQRVTGLRVTADDQGLADAERLGHVLCERGAGVDRGMGQAGGPRVLTADGDPQAAGDPVGGDVDPADRDHFQLAEPLGHVPGTDLAGPLPGAAGVDQHGLAEQGLLVLQEMRSGQAQRGREPVPRRLAGLPRGGLVAAGPGGADRVMPAQPPVPAAGGGQVQDAQQVVRAGQRPQLGPGGDPRPGRRGHRGDLDAGQPLVLGVLGPALTHPPGHGRGQRRHNAHVEAAHTGGVHDLRCRPDGRDQRQRDPLGRGVRQPAPGTGPARNRSPRARRARRAPRGCARVRGWLGSSLFPRLRGYGPGPAAIRSRAHRIPLVRRRRRR